MDYSLTLIGAITAQKRKAALLPKLREPVCRQVDAQDDKLVTTLCFLLNLLKEIPNQSETNHEISVGIIGGVIVSVASKT